MKKITVEENAVNGLCCSCGVCAAICPRKAITYREHLGMFVPVIDQEKCVNCGMCSKICPGFEHKYSEKDELKKPMDAARGAVLHCYNAWSSDSKIRHVAASGGVVTTMIMGLLEKKVYDVAFCVDSYSYDHFLKTNKYTYESFFEQVKKGWKTPKSRYLPVSHEETVRYLISNRQSKVIIVAVPCAIRAIESAIRINQLNRDNYLLIGLFCERNFQYNIYRYFSSLDGKRKLISMHFKNKESGGWPGNVKLFFDDGSSTYKDKSYRVNAKSYFQPERCMYCIDKLAVNADVSLGDNYTGIDESILGSNSVIIRTERGNSAWDLCASFIENHEILYGEIERAEAINDRMINLLYAELKKKELEKDSRYIPPINSGVIVDDIPVEYHEKYQRDLQRLVEGYSLDDFSSYNNIVLKEERKERLKSYKYVIRSSISRFVRKIICYIKQAE